VEGVGTGHVEPLVASTQHSRGVSRSTHILVLVAVPIIDIVNVDVVVVVSAVERLPRRLADPLAPLVIRRAAIESAAPFR
jgi:hypothetical protein